MVWELAEGGTKKQRGCSHVEVCLEEWGCWEGTVLGPQNSAEAEVEGDLGRGWASGYRSGGEVG